MESFVIAGKAKEVFALINLKAQVEKARLAQWHLEQAIKDKKEGK